MDENWDPYSMTLDKFKELILNKKDVFWGDHILIQLIMKILTAAAVVFAGKLVSKTKSIATNRTKNNLRR